MSDYREVKFADNEIKLQFELLDKISKISELTVHLAVWPIRELMVFFSISLFLAFDSGVEESRFP